MIVPLPLPNLDDLTWDDLTAEARSLIPARSQAWTNHNPSDPGITLIELFAYFSERLIYELNRVSAKNVESFLRLINGPDWHRKHPLIGEIRAAVLDLRRPHRAVTAEDFEALALSVNERLGERHQEKVGRAKCIFERNLERPGAEGQLAEAPGHVSVVIVPARRAHPSTALLWEVKRDLDAARLVTTRIHVVRPRFVTVSFAVTLTPRPGADPAKLRRDAVDKLEKFFDSHQGGVDGKGWPFGRSVYVSELYRLLDEMPGVDYVSRSRDIQTGAEIPELIVAPAEQARLRRDSQGGLEAIELRPDELVSVWIEESDITIARR